jgi:hypothetical protein
MPELVLSKVIGGDFFTGQREYAISYACVNAVVQSSLSCECAGFRAPDE